MTVDFTLKVYQRLLRALVGAGYAFQTFEEFVLSPQARAVVLRHDVDRRPQNSLVFARLQAEWGIRATYYFRIVPASFNERIIRAISALGHEIGYHYEEVAVEGQRSESRERDDEFRSELLGRAIVSFAGNLAKMRQVAQIKTICMHGSPMSRWDSRLLWQRYDYRDYGLIGEPYFDIDFSKVFYLTDTGRMWDGERFNVRDKAMSEGLKVEGRGVEGLKVKGQKSKVEGLKVEGLNVEGGKSEVGRFPRFHSTFEIIVAAEEGRLPDKMMMTFHPQRWTDRALPWLWEWGWQEVKNRVKGRMVRG